MDELNELIENLKRMAVEQIKVSTAWVKVKSVDWDSKKMECTGISDDLDWNDVLLGLGSIYQKPVVGTRCLIGRIEHSDAEAFLIAAEEVEEIWLNGDANNGLVKVDVLKSEMEKLDNNLTILKNATKAFATSMNEIVLGVSSTFEAAIGLMQEQDLMEIENEKVKHG